jgi:hypothetical protein
LSNNNGINSVNKLHESNILQIDGGIITGLLVFLTLTSLIPIVSEPFGNVIAILFTAGVIIPFAISAIMVLSNHITSPYRKINKLISIVKKYSRYAGNAAFWGFVYLMGVILALLGINIWSLAVPTPSPVAEVCKKNPEVFGIEPDLCARIVPSGIYEECVMDNMPNVSQCSKFMTD